MGPRKWTSAAVVGTWKGVFEFYHRREECLVASCPVNTWPCAGETRDSYRVGLEARKSSKWRAKNISGRLVPTRWPHS